MLKLKMLMLRRLSDLNLTKELSICHDTISNLRAENASLITKVEKLNACDCRRGNSPVEWRNAPALNPKMRRGLRILPAS
jgi:hypothetical protein